MKKYNIYALNVVKVGSGNNIRYLICKYNELTDTYIEVLTNEKFKINDNTCIEPLSNYYSILSRKKCTNGQPLMLDKKALLHKYIDINNEINLVQNEEIEEKRGSIISTNSTKLLEKATIKFFPKTGAWHSHCFKRPNELIKPNLPCHLRDDVWLAEMLKIDQNLFYMSQKKILNFVKLSNFFQEKRHEYELEIVKWQIQWIVGQGENWICDDKYGGELVYLTPVVDLGIRKGVVDTLTAIGMDTEVIEEGLEKFADLWREKFMSIAFENEYEPVYFLSDAQIPSAEEEHKQKWLKMRRYEYYQRHKYYVDLYGTVSRDMLMTSEEVIELKKYLNNKHKERKREIATFENKNKKYEKEKNLKINYKINL